MAPTPPLLLCPDVNKILTPLLAFSSLLPFTAAIIFLGLAHLFVKGMRSGMDSGHSAKY